jgi:hypothetical protein
MRNKIKLAGCCLLFVARIGDGFAGPRVAGACFLWIRASRSGGTQPHFMIHHSMNGRGINRAIFRRGWVVIPISMGDNEKFVTGGKPLPPASHAA